LSSTLLADRPDVLITLGRTAMILAQQVRPGIPWLAGATELPVPTPGVGGISLIVNPDRFVATLNEVAPRISRIAVVMDPQRFGWLREPMERAARVHSKQVIVYEASTIAEAATHYLNILRYGNPLTDSLWLLEQGQFITADTLPRIIEEAWAKNFLVFSSVLEHVSEGSLFALYMNPRTLGERLGQIARATQGSQAPLAFDDAPARTINLRTARHLANMVDGSTAKSFDLILGER
jgi:putative ABC transport system substrate-binding protein